MNHQVERIAAAGNAVLDVLGSDSLISIIGVVEEGGAGNVNLRVRGDVDGLRAIFKEILTAIDNLEIMLYGR